MIIRGRPVKIKGITVNGNTSIRNRCVLANIAREYPFLQEEQNDEAENMEYNAADETIEELASDFIKITYC